MSEGNKKKGSLTALSSKGRDYVCPSPSSLLSRCWEHLTTRVEAEGAASCMGSYQGKIIMGMGSGVQRECLELEISHCHRSAILPLSLVSPSPASRSLHSQSTFLGVPSVLEAKDKLRT